MLRPGSNFIVQELYSDGEQTEAQRLDKEVHDLNVRIDTILGIPHFEALTRQGLRDVVNRVGLSAVETYESSWPAKCLLCRDAPDCEDPLRKENVDFVIKEIDADLARIIDHPSYEELWKEGELIKERVKVTGSSAASVMYFFGKNSLQDYFVFLIHFPKIAQV